jgi:hypothetical protein
VANHDRVNALLSAPPYGARGVRPGLLQKHGLDL